MNNVVDVFSAFVVLAGIFVLVRPGSQGPSLIKNVFSGFSGVIGSATGGGSWSTS
jgi:hypothetical protein